MGRSTILEFNYRQVQRLIEHAKTAKDHRLTMGQKSARPELWLVKDDGVYLMSNGLPALMPDEGSENRTNFVVYADGFRPDDPDSYELARCFLGGDDFIEALSLEMFENRVRIRIRIGPDTIEILGDDEGPMATRTDLRIAAGLVLDSYDNAAKGVDGLPDRIEMLRRVLSAR